MKSRFIITIFLVSALILGAAAFEAFAFDKGKSKGHYVDFEKKFSAKARLIMSKKEKLDLSDEQVKKIKELKIATKKELIKKDAEIEIAALDLKAELWKDPVDTNAVNKLIDKKYDLKKDKAKYLVAACTKLKDVLTKEQKEKMKDFWKKCKKEKKHSSMKKDMPMKKDMKKCSMKSEE